MMDERLQQIMNDTNAALEPWGLTMGDPNLRDRAPVWHLYRYDPETKYCIPILRKRGPKDGELTHLADLFQCFEPETPAASILSWAVANGVLDD